MNRARFYFRNAVSLALVVGSFACSSAPKTGEYSERELLEAACPTGFFPIDGTKRVRGSVWTKISSPEMNGQFPASVLVEYPRKLAVEVTNLIGSPQAWLKVESGKTELKFTAANEKQYGKPEAREMLGGLPLELAPRLFAGGVPCPSENKNKDVRVREVAGGDLEVIEVDLRSHLQTRYLYTFSHYAGRPWVKEIQWVVVPRDAFGGAGSKPVKIVREDPMDADGAPRRWTASSERGEIQVRWKDRTLN